MKRRTLLLVTLTALIGFTGIGNATAADPTPSLNPIMQKNFLSLLELQKLASTPTQFDDPKNHQKIAAALKALEKNSKHIPIVLKKRGKPGLAPIGEIYSAYVQDMAKNFEKGHTNYVRDKVGTVSQLCLSCHTGTATQKQFKDLDKQVDIIALTPYQKIHFYAATRQFDEAMKSFNEILGPTPLKPGELRQFTQAVKTGLSVAVRVQENAQAGLQIVDKALKKPGVPEFVKGDFKQWQQDLQAWQQDKKSPGTTAAELIQTSKALIKEAKEKQEYPTDHSEDVLYLRASNYLHQALKAKPSFAEQAKIFYLLGLAYGTLRDSLLWDLDQYYYEACIKSLPNSRQAAQCFKTLSSEIFFGYTGSGGTLVPADELNRLDRLQKLAF